MALRYLVDTSVVSRLHREPVLERIAPLVLAEEVARMMVTDLEVGYSARNGAEWGRLLSGLAEFQRAYAVPRDFDGALAVQRTLAELGQRGRKVPDLLIAAVARRRALAVLHYDHDFELIAAVTGQRQEWIVPRGTLP